MGWECERKSGTEVGSQGGAIASPGECLSECKDGDSWCLLSFN